MNIIAWSKLHRILELFDQKVSTILDKALTPFLENVSAAKQLFDTKPLITTSICQCSKYYDIPTSITKLKVAVNLAGPIVIWKILQILIWLVQCFGCRFTPSKNVTKSEPKWHCFNSCVKFKNYATSFTVSSFCTCLILPGGCLLWHGH